MISITADIADLILQSTLHENTIGLNNSIERMSTGYRINRAKDGAANYSIINDLSTKISSMLQVQQNTEHGISLLQTAEGGLEEIQKLLVRLRQLTNQAANDTYDTSSRQALQKEAEEIIKQISQIKNSIEYNGMTLYETKQDTKDTAVTRLAQKAKINGTAINDTSSTFTIKNPVSSSSLLESDESLSNRSISLLADKKIEGAKDFGNKETLTIDIDGVTYTVTNKLSIAQSLSYKKDVTTGAITFYGTNFIIKGQSDVSHNVIINGSNNKFYGGNLNDTIVTVSGVSGNYLYGGAGNDTIIINAANNYAYGEAGDDILTVNSGYSSYLNGGDGNDTINIKSSSNYVYGGNDDDIINIYSSSQYVIRGDAGNDTFNIIGKLSGLTIDGGAGTNKVTGTVGSNITMNVVNANATFINLNSGETKSLTIDGKNYSIKANSATSLIYQNSNGVISFKTSNQNSIIITGDANNTNNVVLNSGYITFYGGTKNDTITINGYGCSVYANNGTNKITINSNCNYVYGQKGNNNIAINSSFNYVDAGSGDNDITIKSGLKNNTMYANGGKNTLTGNYHFTTYVSGFGSADTENITAEELGSGETKTITIGDKQYTIKNTTGRKNVVLYTYNDVTGEVGFCGSNLNINAQKDVSHNVNINGRIINFYGGDKDDVIVNNANNGYIYGLGGNDKITLSSYTGMGSYAYGGDGDDEIILNDSGGRVFGQNGDDKITINAASRFEINGGVGNDTYYINKAATNIIDDGGDNIYYINTDGALVSGSSGDDTFYIKGNNNTILGAGGKDYFVNDGQNNTIDGGTDDNYYVDNGSGTDSSNIEKDPNSGALNFTKNGEVKSFTLNGKKYTITNNLQGANIIKYSLNQNTGVITFDGSNLTIKANANENAIINLRGDNNLVYGSNLADMITIESGSGNTIYGLDGNDTLIMDSENNSLIGGNGNDSIYINATTNKLINSGDDNDTIYVNANNCTNIISGNGDDTIVVSGQNNKIKAGIGDNDITISNNGNIISADSGKNKFTVTSSSNTITTGSGASTFGVQGDGNIIKSGNGNDSFIIRGNSNNITTTGGKNTSNIRGNSNTYQGGSGADNIKIAGDNNKAYGGNGENDSLMISSGSNNTFDGQGGLRNTIINNGLNTTFTNSVDITPHPFELNVKVDIGSGKDKFISTSISFNLFDFSVDLMSQDGALESLEKIDEMMSTVTEQLLNISNTINRLWSVTEAQSVKLDNLISARSTLQDVDIANESSQFVRYQILQSSAATLMASSRNLKAQNVLGLLNNIK